MTFYICQVSHSSRVVACNVHLVPDGPCGAFYRDTTRLALLGRYMLMLSDKPTVKTSFVFSHDLRHWGNHTEEWSGLCRPATLGPYSTTSDLAF